MQHVKETYFTDVAQCAHPYFFDKQKMARRDRTKAKLRRFSKEREVQLRSKDNLNNILLKANLLLRFSFLHSKVVLLSNFFVELQFNFLILFFSFIFSI